ncbi:hypothetical protein U5A82_01180 [Sphingobium sp. CR2-8]|nr:hypothetical protein [Sphingobium sp. CR2-8]MEC3909133.1 hypothetical protein [Sphingobium sp. CR2-8]
MVNKDERRHQLFERREGRCVAAQAFYAPALGRAGKFIVIKSRRPNSAHISPVEGDGDMPSSLRRIAVHFDIGVAQQALGIIMERAVVEPLI